MPAIIFFVGMRRIVPWSSVAVATVGVKTTEPGSDVSCFEMADTDCRLLEIVPSCWNFFPSVNSKLDVERGSSF